MDVEVLDRAPSRDPYPLQGWLFCVCGQAFLRSDGTGSVRKYLSLCGCRLWPIDADVIEQLVYAEVASTSTAAGLLNDSWTNRPAEVFARLFIRIEIGGTVDDIRFAPRTLTPPAVAAVRARRRVDQLRANNDRVPCGPSTERLLPPARLSGTRTL